MLTLNGRPSRHQRREVAMARAPERAVTVDTLPRAGNWYTLPDGSKVQGRTAAAAALRRMAYA